MRFHVTRYSNAIAKNFCVPSSRFESKNFIKALIRIIKEEKINYIIPTFEEIFSLSQYLDAFPPECTVFCSSYDVLDSLHNKWIFNQKIKTFGFDAPRSFLLKSKKDLESLSLNFPFIIKPCYSRASQNILRITSLEMLKKLQFDPLNPWVAQELIKGSKFCTYSVCHGGKLRAHSVYPTQFCIDDNSCLNFVAIKHDKIEDWIKRFVEKEKFTGQIAFDFIETESGSLYAIECNPRGTSGIHLFQKADNLPQAFFKEDGDTIFPQIGFSKQIMVGMFLFGWKKELAQHNLKQYFKQLFRVQDVVFSKDDPKPFISQPFLFIPHLLNCLKFRKDFISTYTYDIDWNGIQQSQIEQVNCE